MTPQVTEYLKQAIRSISYARVECEIGTSPDKNLANTLEAASHALLELVQAAQSPYVATIDPATKKTDGISS